MNLFIEYTKQETELLLSLFRKDYENIEIFDGMSNYEINNLCKYIKKEILPPKKIIEKYDFIWILRGKLIEIDAENLTKIYEKYTEGDFIGLDSLCNKEKNPLVVYSESEVIFFKINEHSELSSKFYKNLTKYLYKKFSKKC